MNEAEKLKYHCHTAKDLDSYLRKKGENHTYYKAYSQMERILPIRDTASLYLDTGESWNDVTDRTTFNPEGAAYKNFGKCFSFSKDENVALWMLYGGMQKRGGMIEFTKQGMASILNTSHIELGYFHNGSFQKVRDLSRADFDIYITDILYYTKEDEGMYIKRSNETLKKVSESVVDGLTVNKKVLAWSYENECRLIVTIHDALVPEQCDAVRISLAGMDLGNSFEKIYCAPNFDGDKPKGTKPSRLSETIDWDLCKGRTCSKATSEKEHAVV